MSSTNVRACSGGGYWPRRGVPAWKYALCNAAGALAWAIAVGGGAYLFGNALEIVFGDIRRYELEVAAVIACAGAAAWALHYMRAKKARRGTDAAGDKPGP